MDSSRPTTKHSNLTNNNKELLKYVLEAILDEIAFSEPNKVLLKHGGLTGNYLDYEKGLVLLKKLDIIKEFRNMRLNKVATHGIYVSDKFEVTFNETNLVDFADTLLEKPSPQADEHTDSSALNNKLKDIKSQKIEVGPRSYDPVNGILYIAGRTIQIIKQPNKKGTLHESKQARLMRYLFKDVKTLRDGVPMRQIVSVRGYDFKPKHSKQVKSYVTEINKKIPQELQIKELVIATQNSVIVDSRYLEK